MGSNNLIKFKYPEIKHLRGFKILPWRGLQRITNRKIRVEMINEQTIPSCRLMNYCPFLNLDFTLCISVFLHQFIGLLEKSSFVLFNRDLQSHCTWTNLQYIRVTRTKVQFTTWTKNISPNCKASRYLLIRIQGTISWKPNIYSW